jgi:hypothetical protein
MLKSVYNVEDAVEALASCRGVIVDVSVAHATPTPTVSTSWPSPASLTA